MNVIVGGSFCYLHKGHLKVLEKAIELASDGCIYVGLTSDKFVKEMNKNYCCSYEDRKKKLEDFFKRKNVKFEILPINDVFGFSLEDGYDAIVVSEETLKNAVRINEERIKRNLKPLEIYTVEIQIAEDLMPIFSRRVADGIIDKEGRRLKKIKINVGSENPVKVNAVKKVFSKYLENFAIFGKKVESGVSPQPKSIDEIILGAFNRAVNSLEDGDYGVGIEAGVVYYEEFGVYVDIQFCFIVDSLGRISFGHGSGFAYPPDFNTKLQKGMEIADIMEELSGIREIRKKMGAIGFLTQGVLSRRELSEQSVLMAMVPRINSSLYKFWSYEGWKVENVRNKIK